MLQLRGRVVPAVLLTLACANSALALRIGRYVLDPKTYASPSGQFRLRVNPSTIYGQGEGSYRMTRGDAETWAKKLPFTLWDAALADDGTVAGYAYSLGMENYPLDRKRSEEGKVHFVILDPKGDIRMNEALPRRGTFDCTSTVDRNVTGFILDPANDRFIVRCREGDFLACGEIWRTFRLSDGAVTDEFRFDHPRTSEHENWFLMAARPVQGTPLILVNWQYTRWDDTGNQLRATGGCFHVIDLLGKAVWELERPNDFPEYCEYATRLDRQKDREEYERLQRIEAEIRNGGAVLRSDQSRRFDLWFVRESQRVTFAVEPDSAGGWSVTEQSRAAYSLPSLPEAPAETLAPLTLQHLGTIELASQPAPAPEIRDIEYFDLDDRGRIGFLRRETDRSTTFLLADSSGEILRSVSLKEPFGERCNLPKAAWLQGDRWLLLAHTWEQTTEGERAADKTRAWWLDADSGKLTPIEPFAGQGARRVAATGDGGFVVTIDPPLNSNRPPAVAAFDREARERWRSYPAPEEGISFGTSGVCVTTDGRIIVERRYGDALTSLDAHGKYVKSDTCTQLLGQGSSSADSVSADLDGGLLIAVKYASGRVYRLRRDGAIGASFSVRHPDGRSVDLVGFPDAVGIRVARDGTLWACDKHSLLQLSAEGIVQRVLGERPDSPELRRIAAVAIDQSGNTYLAEERSGVTHQFDSSGRRTRLLRPNPDDFQRSYGITLDVASDGSVFVDGLQFSVRGERVGFRTLPAGLERPDALSGRIRSHPHSLRYWVISSETITLVGEDNTVLETVKRRADGAWLDRIEASAVAPDGSLAVLAGSFNMRDDSHRCPISLYSAAGEPRKGIETPNLGDELPMSARVVFSGRCLLLGPRGYDEPRYLLLDAAAEPPTWFDMGNLCPYDDEWHAFFVKDGSELWLFAERARKIERFQVPVALQPGL